MFFPLLALTLGLFGIFGILDFPLRTPSAPLGIVSFELAGTPENANAIIESWDQRAKLFAAFGLGLDYLFMPAYALTISLGVLMALRKHGGWFTKIGGAIGWGALLAALFDAVENVFLWRLCRMAAFGAAQTAAFSISCPGKIEPEICPVMLGIFFCWRDADLNSQPRAA